MNLEEIVICHKPIGFNTHAVNSSTDGVLELLAAKNKEKLWPVHRLDRETSGLLLFAKTKEQASLLGDFFENRKVLKTYYFLSRHEASKNQFKIESHIEKKASQWVSHQNLEANSETNFKKLRSAGEISLWQAEPKTGKTHQIRLHAKEAGIPILGDPIYSEDTAPRMFLHCAEMQMEEHAWKSPLPKSFELCLANEAEEIVDLYSQLEVRKLLFGIQEHNSDSFRIYHKENRDLSVDNYAGNLWFNIFNNSIAEEHCVDFFEKFKEQENWKHYLIRHMLNRGKNPEVKIRSSSDIEEEWEMHEQKVKIQLRSSQGQSVGIFLDQRENRKWVFENSRDKKVLNLFSYTCAFSLMAAAGGANKVISVDTSKPSLEWGKEHFKLNEIYDKEKHLFFAMETDAFLRSSEKKDELFDLVICDPPSFARNKKSLFRIENDFEALLFSCWQRTKANGHLLFSSNYEAWEESDFLTRTKETLKANYKLIKVNPGFDYEKPSQKRILKTFLIHKLS